MHKLISRLRIGAKLAIMSGIGIVFVAVMIVSQILGSGLVARSSEDADAQRRITRDAAEIKASVRGLMVGARDIRLAQTPEDIKAASELLQSR